MIFGLSSAHKIPHIEESNLQDGDVILRKGFGLTSTLAKQADGEWSHVGLLHKKQGLWYVIHAHPKDEDHLRDGVQEESINAFLNDSSDVIIVRIAKNIFEGQEAKKKAEMLIGMPFNATFESNRKSLYCSELIAVVFPNEHFEIRKTYIPSIGEVNLIPPSSFIKNRNNIITMDH